MDFDCELLTAGHVSVAARVFSQRGRVGVTVVGKVTFALVPDGVMQLVAPNPLHAAELPRADGVLTSARRASDFALFLQRPEVIAEAVAFAPSGQVETMPVRIAIQRGERLLFSKELQIVGDRTGAAGENPRPLPFASMPITYERAPGGIGQPENPVGVGEESGHRVTLPNVLPSKARPPAASGAVQPPVGFGPVSSAWLHRRGRRGKLPRPLIDEALWVALPDDFDGSYFQAAPSDQQIEDLAPDDELIFEGLHAQHARLRTRLPRMRVVAMVETSQRRRVPVGLRLDTLYFEPHELRAELTFRGVVEVMPEMVPGLKIVAAVEELSRPIVFPADLATLGASVRAIRHRDEAERGPASNSQGTVLLGPPSGTVMLGEAPSSKTLPFDKSRRRSSPKVPVVRAPVIVPAHVAPASQNLSHTLEIPPSAPPVVPVSPAPAPVASPPVAAAPPPAVSPAPSPAPAPAVEPAPPPAPASAPAPAAPAPKPAVSRTASASVWAKPEAPAQPAAPAAPVSRPVVQPSADRSASLYKKFKPK